MQRSQSCALFVPFSTHVPRRLSCRTRVSFWSCGNKPFAPGLGWREGWELQDSIPAPCCDIRPVLVLPPPTSRICHTVLCILCSRDTRLYLPHRQCWRRPPAWRCSFFPYALGLIFSPVYPLRTCVCVSPSGLHTAAQSWKHFHCCT